MPEAATSPLPDDPALLRIEGPIATITLNRPAAFNSVNLAIAQRLEQLAAEVEGDDDIRVLVIEGEGRAFSAGGDLQTIGAAAAADTIAPVVGELLKHYHAFITSLRRMPKIVLSSVHGSAAGAGMSLAFVDGHVYCRGRRPLHAGLWQDRRVTGWRRHGRRGPDRRRAPRAADLSRRGQFFGPQAYDWGLVAKVVPAAELKAATRALAERLAQNAPAAIAATKALIYRAPTTPVEQQLDAEKDGIIDCMHTDEFRVAVKKFTSKGK